MSVFFFFKQKTAYEMRISYWSSDVCSSDLVDDMPRPKNAIPTKKVTPTITMAVHDRLVRLAKIGIYGSSPAEVARHLIVSGLDDLTKTGVLPNDHQTTG